MHPIAVTDFVLQACSRACHKHQAALQLHQAGKAFSAIPHQLNHNGMVAIGGIVALLLIGLVVGIARRGSASA